MNIYKYLSILQCSNLEELVRQPKYGKLDYTNALQPFAANVISNTTYTIPVDGMLYLVASSISSSGSVSASISGVMLANWRDNGASSSTNGAIVFSAQVKQGDIVELGASSNAYFTSRTRLVPYST